MYWNKANLSILYAILLSVALFFLLGCIKKEENPKPTALGGIWIPQEGYGKITPAIVSQIVTEY